MPANDALKPWSASEALSIPINSTPEQLVSFAQPQLSKRDMTAIVSGLNSESYEMVATFVWTKAVAVLKKQVATLGMEFVGEMLARPDLDEDSDPATSISDNEAISLAEDLGMITATQGLRLKHALELVAHFTKLDTVAADEEAMSPQEVHVLLRTCITSIFSRPKFEGAIRFADFRKALAEQTLKSEDLNVQTLSQSPYFFIRTTLSVLLSLVKTAKGAVQEHAVGNAVLLLPILWARLREPEKWQVGQAYAEVNSEGNRVASSGLKKALLKVHGFDFVPESLRSNTFSEAAARVLSAHFGFNNFYNEQQPMGILADLGTAIPRPAFAKCMEATLAVWLGNAWGPSFAAAPSAKRVLDSLRTEQWEYYLNQCLRRDRTVLDKLVLDVKPGKRWIELAKTYEFNKMSATDHRTEKLVDASINGTIDQVQQRAEKLRDSMAE